MKRKHLLLGFGLCAATLLALFGDKTPNGAISEPVKSVRANAPAKAAPLSTTYSATRSESAITPATKKIQIPDSSSSHTKNEPALLALKNRQQLIGHDLGTTASLFAAHSWAPPPPPPPKPLPPPPPMAPPLPFTYLGKSKEGDQWQVFLARENTTFILKVEDMIDNLYRIESITPPTMTLMYLPLKQTQNLQIE